MRSYVQYSKRRMFVLSSVIAMMSATLFIVSCSLLTPTPLSIRSTDIPYWGSTARSPDLVQRMPDTLSCMIVPNTLPARGVVSWRSLTVGVSSFDDVAKTLVTDGVIYGWDRDRGGMSFSSPGLYGLEIDACFVGEMLAVLYRWGGVEPDMAFSELTQNYGNPDLVTWANQIYQRSLIWAEKGLLVIVEVEMNLIDNKLVANGNTQYILLFSPIPRCQLEESWIFQSLPKTVEPYRGDVAMITTEAEDPWKMEKGLADCPKK